MTAREIIAIAITVVVLAVDLITDYRLRLKYMNVVKPEGSVKHSQGLWIRGVGLAPAIWLSWWALTPLLLFGYWHLFDGLTNVLWKNNWFRIGTTGYLDKLQRKYPAVVWFKYIGLAGSIALLIVVPKLL